MIRLFQIFFTCLIAGASYAQQIALTFDDAPMEDGAYFTGNERTDRIIAQLKANNVKEAAFFVITKNIETNKGLPRLKKYVAAGHVLANHTHRHRWIHQLGTFNYIKDIEKADSILKTIKGYSPWFRYPFLDEGRPNSTRDSIRVALKNLGLTNGYVTIDNYDWHINGQVRKAILDGKKINEEALKQFYLEHIWNSIQFYDNIAKQHLGRSPKHVLLLHENDLSAKFIGDLIQFIQSKGWKIISTAEAYSDPIASEVPDVLFNGQGRVAAIARAKGVPPKDLVQESEDEEYLDRLMAERKIIE
ncbi:MAG TPA: polysaccharide deacetylase family protein [Chryseosolibacter sp.]